MNSKHTSMAIGAIAGASFAVAFMLSCGDSSPSRADAACECPASEPPLMGRFVTDGASTPLTIQPGTVDRAVATCPEGAQLISGSCTAANPSVIPADLVLLESGTDPPVPPAVPHAWGCSYKNTGTMPVDVRATVICLKPGS